MGRFFRRARVCAATWGRVVEVMSISRLSAGAGYRYVTQNTASADVRLGPEMSLMAYYAATQNPAGWWLGSGLSALGGDGLKPGQMVTEKEMAALYGTGHDPVTGEQLGRPYPTFKSAAVQDRRRGCRPAR